MNCEAVRELLWAYLAKETTAEEAEKIEEHLKCCKDCVEELEIQKEMQETLSGLPDEELPEGYHAELMQKLRAEATSNVVPFPQKTAMKKKRQPLYKQWGMIAAAVLVVVAAGGVNGMLDMRESQNAAVSEMKAVDNVDHSADDMAAAEEESAETQAKTTQKPKVMNVPSADMDVAIAMIQEDAIVAYESGSAAEMVSEESTGFSMVRSAKPDVNERVELFVADDGAAMTELQKVIAENGGYEEPAAEGSIFAVIPVENYESFMKAVENIGALTWTQKSQPEQNAAYQTIEFIFVNN